MQLLDLKEEPSTTRSANIVVELIQMGHRCQFRARDMAQRMEVQPVDAPDYQKYGCTRQEKPCVSSIQHCGAFLVYWCGTSKPVEGYLGAVLPSFILMIGAFQVELKPIAKERLAAPLLPWYWHEWTSCFGLHAEFDQGLQGIL